MHYEKTGRLEAPAREPGEAVCTPRQVVELACFCPAESYDKIQKLGTGQAAQMLTEACRLEKELQEEVRQAEATRAEQDAPHTSRMALTFRAKAGSIRPKS
jgi:hypothetical protein